MKSAWEEFRAALGEYVKFVEGNLWDPMGGKDDECEEAAREKVIELFKKHSRDFKWQMISEVFFFMGKPPEVRDKISNRSLLELVIKAHKLATELEQS